MVNSKTHKVVYALGSSDKTITEMEAVGLEKVLTQAGVNIEKLLAMYKVSSFKELTPIQYAKIIGQLKAKDEQ